MQRLNKYFISYIWNRIENLPC